MTTLTNPQMLEMCLQWHLDPHSVCDDATKSKMPELKTDIGQWIFDLIQPIFPFSKDHEVPGNFSGI